MKYRGRGSEGAWMAAMVTFDEFGVGSGYIGKGNPAVFVGGRVLPAHEILVTLAELAAVEDGVDGTRGRVFKDFDGSGGCVGVEVRGIVVGFKKGNMEDGMEA